MRILHLLNSDRFSGAENVACKIIEMFKEDTSVEMAYCSPDGQIRDILAERNINFYPVSKLTISEIKRVLKLYNPDIIHSHDYTASVLVSLSGTNKIVISHLHNNSPWLQKKGLKSFAFMFGCMRSAKILTVSESIMKEYVFAKKYLKKVDIVGNPFDAFEVRIKAEEISINKHYDIVFLGRLTPQKNPFLFLKIIQAVSIKIPDVSVAIIGDGELKNDVLSAISEMKLTSNIEFVGFQKNPFPFLKNSKLMCMPSKWEGFGLAAAEALSLGLPVVCSGVGGLPGIVNDSCGKICSLKDQYVDEIICLLQNEDMHKSKSLAAVERANILSNINDYSHKMVNLYRELMKSNLIIIKS